MTAEEFWHGPPRLARAYADAWRMRQQGRAFAEWRTGFYVYKAILAAAPAINPFIGNSWSEKYPDRPLFLAGEAEQAARDAEAKARMERNRARFEAMAKAANEKLAGREPARN